MLLTVEDLQVFLDDNTDMEELIRVDRRALRPELEAE